jgi:ABC-type multidrug transport system permease subunit
MVYFLAGLTTEAAGTHFFLFLLCFWGARWVGIAFTQLCGTVFATIEAANGLQSAILTVFMLFCGFLISKGNIPSGWIWMYYLSFIRYPLDFLIANEVLDLTFTCDPSEMIVQFFSPNLCPDSVTPYPSNYAKKCPIACGRDLLSQFQIDYGNSDIALNLGLVFVWLAGFLTLGYLALRYVNHIKR